MPNSVIKDEEKWKKAREVVEKEYGKTEKDGEDYWKLVMGVYKKMGGETTKQSKVSESQAVFLEMYRPTPKNMKALDLAFQELLDDPEKYEGPFREIINVCKAEFNVDLQMRMIKIENKGHFFGMRVLPSKEELEDIALEIVKKKDRVEFKQCKNLVVEIDTQILNGKLWKEPFTARELTAILLHEFGHKVYSNELQEELRKLYAKSFLSIFTMGAATALAFTTVVPFIVCFLTVAAAMIFSGWSQKRYNNEIEKDADSFPAQCGYGPEIHSVLTKFRDTFRPDLKPSEKDGSVANFIRWAAEQTTHIGIRRRSVAQVLRDELKNAQTDYERELLESQIKIIERRF